MTNGSRKCLKNGAYLRDDGGCTKCERRNKPAKEKSYTHGNPKWGLADEKHYLDLVGSFQLIPKHERKWYLNHYPETLALRHPQPYWAQDAKDYCIYLLKKEYGVTYHGK